MIKYHFKKTFEQIVGCARHMSSWNIRRNDGKMQTSLVFGVGTDRVQEVYRKKCAKQFSVSVPEKRYFIRLLYFG